MGDYASAELRLYGVAGNEQRIFEALGGWNAEYGLGPLSVESIVEGVTLNDEAAVGWAYGYDGELPALKAIGISFEFYQDAKYEWDGTVLMYTPDLGEFTSTGGAEGAVLLNVLDIERVLEQAETIHDARVELDKLTGLAWRDRFETLRHAADLMTINA